MTLVRFPAGGKGGWESELTLTTTHKIASTTANFASILRNDATWAATLGFNERSCQILWCLPPAWRASERAKWQPAELCDTDFARLAEWFERSRFAIPVSPNSPALIGAVANVAHEHGFDPVADYLSSLAWDGQPRIERLSSDYFGASDDNDDAKRDYLAAAGACSLISAVARTFAPGCQADHVLVLVGAQGLGKSRAIRVLAGEHVADGVPDLRSKDAADFLRGPLIVELSELDSLKRAELATVKAFVTRTHDRFRGAYARRTESHARRCIFIGSTNEDQFLVDATGNRRFWPVSVRAIDLEALQRDRDQIWAEAVARYRAGKPWHLSTERLVAAAVRAQEERQTADVWEPYVQAFIAGRVHVSVQDVLRALDLRIEECGQREQTRVARCLRQLGWERYQARAGKNRVWGYRPLRGPQ